MLGRDIILQDDQFPGWEREQEIIKAWQILYVKQTL